MNDRIITNLEEAQRMFRSLNALRIARASEHVGPQDFMHHALSAAQASPDPHTKVGAVLVAHDVAGDEEYPYIITEACNSLPFNRPSSVTLTKENKDFYLVHAEAHLLALCARYRLRVRNTHLYVTLPPCCHCVNLCVAAGIKRIYVPEGAERRLSTRWTIDCSNAKQICRDYAVEYVVLDMGGANG